MLNKDYLSKINPNQEIYNSKYSEGTYRFLRNNLNNKLKVYWRKSSFIDGSIVEFTPDVKIYSTQIYFMYDSNGDWLGTSWAKIMRNNYQVVMDFTNWNRNDFLDITEWFLDEYLKVGRCLFDQGHINFFIGKDRNYVTEDERFEFKGDLKICKWCGKEIDE